MPVLSSTTANQIRFLLQSLGGGNADSVLRELSQFIEFGTEGSILVLQTCLDHLNRHNTDSKNVPLEKVVASVFKLLLNRPNFSTVFCESLRNSEISKAVLENFSSSLQLSVPEKICIGLALSNSENSETRISGNNFCVAQIEELCANPVNLNYTDQILSIVSFLQHSEGLSKYVDSFMQMLSLVQLKDVTTFVLTPLFSDEQREAHFLRNMDLLHECEENDFDVILAEMEKEMSMGDIMKELGYGCTVEASQCKEILSLFLPLTEVTISKILGTIACTHVGLEDNQNTFSTFSMALGFNTSSDLPSLNSWNIDVLIDTIQLLAPITNWIQVIENLDHEGFCIPNQEAFFFLMSVYKRVSQEPFPIHAVCGSVWKNTEGQLSFLKYAVSASPEVFSFSHSVRQLAYVDAVNKLHVGHANHAWLCLDLLGVLCQLAERGHACTVRSMLQYPLQQCPEILLLGMAYINTAYNLLQHEVSSLVFPMIVKNAMGSAMILHLWHINAYLVLRGFVDAHKSELDSIAKILDICQEIKILSSVLDVAPFSFSIRLAALASRKELVDLDKWLSNHLNVHKDVFFEECLKYLKEIQLGGSHDSAKPFQHAGGISNLYADATTTFLKVLNAHVGLLTSGQLSEELERLCATNVEPISRLQNGGSTDSNADGYADDIESEANSYFHQMFSGQLTIDAMVQMLARFKESPVRREKSIFECMIANLFEEYRFFPEYPERQLKIAAVLFGSVIKNQLVTHLTLGIALRSVLDALHKPADSKMFVFGTKALEQFVDRLIEWPQYCNHILQISHLRSTHSELVAFIEQALARISSGHLDSEGVNQVSAACHHNPNQVTSANVDLNVLNTTHPVQQVSSSLQLQQRHEGSFDDRLKSSVASSTDTKPPLPHVGQPLGIPTSEASGVQKLQSASTVPSILSSSSPGFVRPSRAVTSQKFGAALNIETLVAAAEKRGTPIEAPASEIQDKISFIINNISVANIDAKAKEFNEIFKEQYYPWFAQYMVMKRASIEPNFHDLYLKFLDKVDSKALNREIVKATYENCKALLGSDRIKSSSEERSLLKNLGSWLGKLTIGRNQVLLAREIDPKQLITQAYVRGLMIAVIPFTSKILEPCQNSLAYQPPNPWTMGILGLLAEIYSMPNLKMNLKFDIEVLFNKLGVDLKEIPPTSLLKDYRREIEGNPDFSTKDVGASQPQMVAEVKPGIMAPLNPVESPMEVAPSSNSAGHRQLLPQYAAPIHLSCSTIIEDDKLAALSLSDQLPPAQGLLLANPSPFSVNQLPTQIPNIGTHVIINQKLSTLGLHLHFQRVVPIAMDRAIKDIVSSIVQRSVSIAMQTTKELVFKDYAMELDETRIFNAAHLMVASLAGSLAHVTCKEPLRTSILSQLRNSLQGLNIASELLEQAVQIVTNDNLDLGCAVIEQAATDKAIQTIDGEITQQLSSRRKHRESVGSAFFEANMYSQGSMGIVPEALRPKPGHLSNTQQRVYEDFVRLPLQNQSSQSSHAMPVGPSASSANAGLPSAYVSASTQLNAAYSAAPANSGFEAASRPLDEAIDSISALQISAPSIHVGMADGLSQQSSDNEPAVSSFVSAATAPELQSVDSCDVVKESGASSPVPSPATAAAAAERLSNIPEPSLSTRDALDKYLGVSQKLVALVTNEARESEIQGVVSEVPEIILRCVSRDEAALAVAQKVFKGLYKNASNQVHVGAHLSILTAIRDVCKLVVKELTSWVIYSEEERKFNKDITIGLIHSELLNLAEYNVHMAKLIDGGRNKAATEFSISLLQALAVDESKVISELHNLVDALAKLASKPGSPESLQQLVEMVKNPAANVAASSALNIGKDDKARQSRDKKAPSPAIGKEEFTSLESVEPDPVGFRDQVSMLFAEWYRICELPGPNDAACTHYIMQLHQKGLLKGDEMTERFFHLLTELSVAHCLSSEVISAGPLQAPLAQNISFLAIDIYAKIVYYVLKGSNNKAFLLSKILAVTVRFIQKDADEKKTSFNPRPYFRLFINWLLDLGSLEPLTDGSNFQILTSFASAFHALQPLKVPAFSFAWLELVSHRSFLPKMLTGNGQKGWPYIQRLLVDLFQFMEPFLREADLAPSIHFLYKRTLKVLLVLLHDFPEFLCDYHFTFCDVIPASCIQMRNIILSAFPRNMRLPDPSTPNLKIDLLAEITQSPRILSEVDAALKAKQMKADVDEYLKTRPQNSPFLAELKPKLLLPPSEAAITSIRYNVPLLNSLVLYVGMQAIQQLQARTAHGQSTQAVPLAVFLVGAALDIFQTLIVELDTEGRYLFLNAVANQLRYPNTHTHYFSFILLYLFAESSQHEIIQEQITRVLLERLIVNRPHPWGLLITFIELIKNPRYNFWNRGFIRCAPEIEKLFESVSRSCGGPKPVDDSMVSGWVPDTAH